MWKNNHFFALALLAATIWPSVSQADLVVVFRGNNDGTTAELTGTFTGSETFSLDSTSGAGTAAATYTYTIGNLDAAEDGTANDSLTAIFGVTSAGGNVAFQDDGNFGVTGNGAGNLNDVSESLAYTLIGSSVSLGDGGTGSVTGGGFNQIQFTNLNSASETASLSGTDADGSVTGTTTFASTPTFTVGHNDDGSNFRVGPARYRFVITTETVAVPEPTSALLLAGIGGLVMVRRNRKTRV
jgi:hypothetical protein